MNSKIVKAMNSKIVYSFDEALSALEGDNVYVVTDSNVARLYPFAAQARGTIVPAGEDSKSPATWAALIADMVKTGCNRKTTVVAVGGGVVGDLAGFAAATFMRGVRWINIPTTLLAQVDSAIGGKTAVDVEGYKNVAGAFWLPETIYIAEAWLETLPEREIRCGMGEILKTALLSEKVYALYGKGLSAELIRACADFKKDVTERDFTESGLRKILNVGHTLGHALEREDGHRLSHGEYVAMGLQLESFLCRGEIDEHCRRFVCREAERIAAVCAFDPCAVADTAMTDKKNDTGIAVVMAVVRPGEVRERAFTREQLIEGLNEWKLYR